MILLKIRTLFAQRCWCVGCVHQCFLEYSRGPHQKGWRNICQRSCDIEISWPFWLEVTLDKEGTYGEVSSIAPFRKAKLLEFSLALKSCSTFATLWNLNPFLRHHCFEKALLALWERMTAGGNKTHIKSTLHLLFPQVFLPISSHVGATALQCGINGAKFGRSRGQEAILLQHGCMFGVEVYDRISRWRWAFVLISGFCFFLVLWFKYSYATKSVSRKSISCEGGDLLKEAPSNCIRWLRLWCPRMCACWYRKRSIRVHMLSPPHIVIPVLFVRNNIPFHPSLMFFSTWVAPKIMATSQHSYIHFRSRKRRNIKNDLQLPDLEPVWRPWVNGEQCHLTKGSWYIYIYYKYENFHEYFKGLQVEI